MGLRSYLMKRAAHTFVTILVVLVLMFVLFRLMPGDPTIFLIQPGLSPADRDAQRVAFGFARWESAPGVFMRGSLAVPDPGVYAVSVELKDSAENSKAVYAVYVSPAVPLPGSPILILRTYADPANHVFVGSSVTITAQVVTRDPTALSNLRAWALVKPPAGPEANVTMTRNADVFTGTYTPNETGVFSMRIDVMNIVTAEFAEAPFGIAANPTPADLDPFYYVENEDPRGAIFTATSPYSRSTADVFVIVQSRAGTMGELHGTATNPEGKTQAVDLSHPLIAVPLPEWEQFWYYLVGMLTGNFGSSFTTGRPVAAEIADRVGPTLLLFGTATILSVLIGIAGGVLLAWFRGTKGELGAIVASLFFYSMPIFWFGLILLYLFAYTWSLFPLGGIGCVTQTGERITGFACAVDVLWHMTLPLVSLVVLNFAGYVLLMRNSLLEVLGEDFVTVARAKGLKERKVMYKHAARNAMLPVTTVTAIAMATVISGGVLTETIFTWPGMGYYFVSRTISQDFPAVQAAFFILALLTILGNVVADIAYAYLDPRVRL